MLGISALSLCLLLLIVSPALANTHFSAEPGSCQIIGDQDVYGIGIRIGYYLQWGAVLFANWIAPTQTKTARTASNIITIAVYANTFRGVTHGGLIAAEWFVVYWMVFLLPIGNWPSSLKLLKNSTSSLGIMLLLWSMILLAGPWLYFQGLETGMKPGCEVKVFLFAPINVFSKGYLTFQKVMSVFGVVTGGMLFVGGLSFIIAGTFGSWNEPSMSDDDDAEINLGIAASLTCVQMSIGAVSIPFIEMTLRANKVDLSHAPLTDSGQMIPFLVGVFTVVATFGSGLKSLIRHLKG